jgi:predicted outer membrane protein
MRFIVLCLLPLAGCASSSKGLSADTARQLNRDQRYAHDSSGTIINGPSYINELVVGQRDLAGNVHVTTDRWFLERANQLACAQVTLAQLATQRGAGAVPIGHRVVEEQERLEQKIRDEGHRHNFHLPEQRCVTDSYQQLSGLTGPEFDHNYLAVQRSLAAEQLALWDDILQSTNDPRIAQFAFDTRPQLQSSYVEIDRYRM